MSTHSSSIGRPPRHQGFQRHAIGVDVGGTKISAGVVSTAGQMVEKIEVPTASVTQELPAALVDIVDQLRSKHPNVEAIGVGAAGLVEWPHGFIRWAPNNSYRNVPLRDLVASATGLPTVVDNDANVAAWAEARVRNNDGYSDFVYLTIGTGVGGGIVLDGKLYRGRSGLGAEIGHLVVDPSGDRCGCGNQGCLEAMASGAALERLAVESVATNPHSYLARLSAKAGRVNGELVFEAARSGDPAAKKLFDNIGYWLGIGIASLVNIFELEAVAVGGGLSETGGLLLDPARDSYMQHAFAPEHRGTPPIIASAHGADAGIIGAANLSLYGCPEFRATSVAAP